MYPPGSTTATRVYGQGGSFTSGACNLGGSVSATTLCGPRGIAIDSGGNLWVADQGSNRVLMWSNASSASNGAAADVVLGQINFTFDTTGGDSAAQLSLPTAVATDSSGNLYVADTGNNRVVLFRSASTLPPGSLESTVFGQTGFSLNGSAAGATGLNQPNGVATDGGGNLYVTDTDNNRVLFYLNPSGASNGEAATQVYGQSGFSGVSANEGGSSPTSASLSSPYQAFVSGAGTLYVADLNNSRVLAYGGGLSNQPYGAAPFSIGAITSAGLTVSFASTTTGICTVSGSTVTLIAGGTCTIQATQAGNANYAAATPVNQSFTVTLAAQTITFPAPANQAFSATAFALSATASSSLTVSFASTTTGVCTVSGVDVTTVALGTCTIQASRRHRPVTPTTPRPPP